MLLLGVFVHEVITREILRHELMDNLYVCVCVCVCVCVRVCVYIYTHTHTHTHNYIYIIFIHAWYSTRFIQTPTILQQ
jgi:hypothetical protein